MTTSTSATAARIADDITGHVFEPITAATDVKLAIADYTEYHPLPEYLEDAVYAELIGRLA